MYVLLNGIIQNQAPQTYLRIDQLSPQTYRCRILFEDSRMGHVDRLISLQPTSENRFLVGPGVMNAFDIFSMGAVPYGPSFQAQSIPNQQVIVYHQSPLPMQQITTTTVTEDDWGPDFMDVSFGILVVLVCCCKLYFMIVLYVVETLLWSTDPKLV